MKKKLLILGALAMVLLVGCSKQKSCRCVIRPHGSDQQDPALVRVITLKKSVDCRDLNYIDYDQDELHVDWRDTLLCIDYEFDIDSIFNK